MKLDTNETGWESVFMPWEQKLMNAIYQYPEGLTSRTGWEAIEKERSRASVINALYRWNGEGLVRSIQRTGKGGYHDVYFPTYPDRGDLEDAIKKKFTNHMLNHLGEGLVK